MSRERFNQFVNDAKVTAKAVSEKTAGYATVAAGGVVFTKELANQTGPEPAQVAIPLLSTILVLAGGAAVGISLAKKNAAAEETRRRGREVAARRDIQRTSDLQRQPRIYGRRGGVKGQVEELKRRDQEDQGENRVTRATPQAVERIERDFRNARNERNNKPRSGR